MSNRIIDVAEIGDAKQQWPVPSEENRAAVIYARLSPRPKEKAEKSISIEMQVERCRAYCLARGWHVVAEFADPNSSGKADDRKRRMLADAIRHCRAHKAVLVCYSLSRLTRNTELGLKIARLLRRTGLAIIGQSVDTTTAIGRFTFTIHLAVDTYERERISELTRAAALYKLANGIFMGTDLPYGTMLDPGNRRRFIACPAEMVNVESIKSFRYEQKMSWQEIADAMTAIGALGRDGQKWTRPRVRRVLTRWGDPAREMEVKRLWVERRIEQQLAMNISKMAAIHADRTAAKQMKLEADAGVAALIPADLRAVMLPGDC